MGVRRTNGAGTLPGARPLCRVPSDGYGTTFSIFTLPLPATVPAALTSWTSPKKVRPSGAAPATRIWAVSWADPPAASLIGCSAVLISPRDGAK